MADFDSGNDETGEERTAYLTYVRRCMYVILPVGTVMSFMVPVFFLITSAVTLVGTFIFSFWKISKKNKWKTICVDRTVNAYMITDQLSFKERCRMAVRPVIAVAACLAVSFILGFVCLGQIHEHIQIIRERFSGRMIYVF